MHWVILKSAEALFLTEAVPLLVAVGRKEGFHFWKKYTAARLNDPSDGQLCKQMDIKKFITP